MSHDTIQASCHCEMFYLFFYYCFFPNFLCRLIFGGLKEKLDCKWFGHHKSCYIDMSVFCFADGRPPVLGKGQLRRKVKQFAFSVRLGIYVGWFDVLTIGNCISFRNG